MGNELLHTYSGDFSANFGVGFFVVYLLVIIFYVVSFWKLFAKAGQPGWAAVIPIYNLVVLLRIIGKPWWWVIFLLIPFINFVVAIIVYYYLAQAFGKGAGFTLGLIFLNIIFIPILAFGNSVYQKPTNDSDQAVSESPPSQSSSPITPTV